MNRKDTYKAMAPPVAALMATGSNSETTLATMLRVIGLVYLVYWFIRYARTTTLRLRNPEVSQTGG